MDRAGLITLEQARAAGLSFDEPEPRACPHCGAALDPLGAALAGRVAWVSAAPCPCEGAASEREAEARRRAALAAKEEAARREKALSRAGIPRRYRAAEADRPEFAEYIASFAGNGGAGLYIHGGVGAGKTHAASAMARLFAEAGYDVAFTTAKGMLERVKATFDEGGTEAAVARYAKCDVLVLDDLGKEDATEWSVGTVFSVLDARYEDMRPTIVTSNYAPGALADRLARRGERVTAEAIASRINSVEEKNAEEAANSVSAALPTGGFVILDTELNDDLIAEGYARDVIRAVQDARKAADLQISDRIALKLVVPAEDVAKVEQFKKLVSSETLATSFEVTAGDELNVEVAKA